MAHLIFATLEKRLSGGTSSDNSDDDNEDDDDSALGSAHCAKGRYGFGPRGGTWQV